MRHVLRVLTPQTCFKARYPIPWHGPIFRAQPYSFAPADGIQPQTSKADSENITGGHYGPAFYNYFYEQNELIANGTTNGTQLQFHTLGIINGIISESIQAPWYPEFAVNNTYGIKAVNDTVYEYMKFACNMIGGCLDQCAACETVNRSTDVGMQTCFQATDQCRNNVESPYVYFGDLLVKSLNCETF